MQPGIGLSNGINVCFIVEKKEQINFRGIDYVDKKVY
jgi:hypothetical protein